MFDNVYLIGVGLINASLAKDLKRERLAKTIIGIGRNAERLGKAQSLNIIDKYQLIQEADVTNADVVVIGVPVSKIKDSFDAIKSTINQKNHATKQIRSLP